MNKVIWVNGKCILVADIGKTIEGNHVGIDNKGNVYITGIINNKGGKYNFEKDGYIEFWDSEETIQ